MTVWAITIAETGELVRQFDSPTHPRFHGFAWESGVHTATALAARGDPAVQSWDAAARRWVDDPEKVEALLLDAVRQRAAAAVAAYLTQGKAEIYAAKRGEVAAWRLGEAAAMSAEDIASAFPFAWAEASARGEGVIDDAITRFASGVAAADAAIAAIEAALQVVTTQIRAAETAAAKRAVLAAAQL
ncbi:hypothetical protein [Sphingomonas hengshuiensis]|uniref:Uncharacterized protein n=1 Tax=Sphingomonas hengshuiensis TaxID=1609977 RepID=A0A7U4J9V8_9SPHN|nr:hypothetical protein [Sphingomonas hengshuiensis]AJP72921.1 hypothetical protein TS85_15675 [Sphingomonas hengshuiensis]